MKKKLVISMLAAMMAFTVMPTANAATVKKTTTTTTITTTEEEGDEEAESDELEDEREDGGYDENLAGQLTKGDIRTSPAKKTIKVGKSFTIDVIPEDDSEWEDLPDEEWDELCEDEIDQIVFRSTNSSVASVNKKTGLVKGRKKGSAVIKATITLASGDSAVYKTKVYVVK